MVYSCGSREESSAGAIIKGALVLKNSSCICNVDQSKERSSLFLSAGFDGVLFLFVDWVKLNSND